MGNDIIYEKRIIVKNKVITKKELKEIIKILSSSHGDDFIYDLNIKMLFDDDSKIEGINENIFDNKIIDDKNITEIKINLFGENKKVNVFIDLESGMILTSNYIDITTNDYINYKYLQKEFEDLIKHMDNRSKLLPFCDNFIFVQVAYSILSPFLVILLILNSKSISFTISGIAVILLTNLILKIASHYSNMFPSIYFDFDNKINRKKLSKKNFHREVIKEIIFIFIAILFGYLIDIII